MATLLTARNLETWYGSARALHGVNLEIGDAQIVTVLGANGAGKTTLLNTIAGVLAPVCGSVQFQGSNIEGLDADQVARNGVVLVPEGRQVFPYLSVSENLQMGAYARPRGSAVDEDLARVYGWFPRLHERRRQAAGLLSGGEQQMVAIGRAYMARPRLLLLDEPSLGLSPLLTKEIFAIVRRIRDDVGIAVLVVEQNAAIALATSDYGYVLELGRVVAAGSSHALSERDDIKEFYLGGGPAKKPAGAAEAPLLRPQTTRA